MATGQLERIEIVVGGTGYDPASPPAITVAAPTGSGTHVTATAVAVVSSAGVLLAALLTEPGRGYGATVPGVAIAAPPGLGTQATARAVLGLASYATIAQWRAYLPESVAGVITDDDVQDELDRATDTCNSSAVGLGFAFAGYTVESRPVRSTHGPYLLLPAHARNSVAAVSLLGQVYVAGVDYQVILDSDGVHESLFRVTNTNQGSPTWFPVPTRDNWGWMGFVYDVIAAWGYGRPPASLVEVCLEIAINIHQSRKAGRFTNVIGGSDGGAVGYEGAMTPGQKAILKGLKDLYTRDVIAI